MVARRFGLPVRVLAGVVALVVSLGVLAGAPGLWPVPGAHATPVSTTDNPYVKPTKPVVPAAGAAVKNQYQGSGRGILLDSGIQSADVVSVTFLDSQTGVPSSNSNTERVWDAGDPGNGSTVATDAVKGWATKNGDGKWDVYYGTTTRGRYPSLPADSSCLFASFFSLTKIVHLDKVNTSNVTNMNSMFRDCSQLSDLDVSHFDTSNVTGMATMFSDCSGLSSVDVSHFDTSNVTTMQNMFLACSGLSNLDVSHFDTSKVTDMAAMFGSCERLSGVDVSHFNTANVTDMAMMFEKCSGLTSLDLSSFNTSKVLHDQADNTLNRKDMLKGLPKLQSLTLGANFTLTGSEMTLGEPDQSVEKTGYTIPRKGWWYNVKTGNPVYQANVAGQGVYTAFRPNRYAVHFDGNAPEGATVTGSMAEQSFTYDEAAKALSSNLYRRLGYTFVNWSTKQSGADGQSYTDAQSVQNLTATDAAKVNLYAQWTANSYTVRFDAGADGVTGSMADQKFTYDVKQALSANVFVRTGYTFAGWKVKNSVSTLSADSRADTYEDKAEVSNLTADADGVVTLVAQWTKNAEPVKPSEPSTPSDPSNPSRPSGPSAPSNPSSPSTPSTPSTPSNPSGSSNSSTPSNSSGSSISSKSSSSSGSSVSRSLVTSAGKHEMSDLASTGVSGVPAVLVALVLAGVGVAIGIVRKRA